MFVRALLPATHDSGLALRATPLGRLAVLLHRAFISPLLGLLALLTILGSASLAPAAWANTNTPSTNNIAAELVAESAIKPGETIFLALHMRPQTKWHGYWLNPGDAGLGMDLQWQLPAGAQTQTPLYPVPSTLLISGLMNHVYKGDYAVLIPFTAPTDAKDALPVRVQAQWLACTDTICVPEQATLETTIPVAQDTPKPNPRFDAWRAHLPAPLDTQGTFATTSKNIRIAIPLPANVALENPHFFSATDKAINYAAPQQFHRKNDWLIITLERARFGAIEPSEITGVLRLNTQGDGLDIRALSGAVPEGGVPVENASNTTVSTLDKQALPWLLFSALLGGLLLNIMPCVFPILSLKAMSLARAGESEKHARQEGLAYTAGVILACLALGGLLLALRAAGAQVGWAFQLQEPITVIALLLLAITITINFWGGFEFAIPGFARAGAPQNAFATGLLAAFAATPCTGPFMAAAMGAAILLPTAPALLLFAMLGLGLALPFLALAFLPALRRMLPRPGAWMVTFRRWMALPMGLTAGALLWLATRLGGWPLALLGGSCACILIGVLLRIGHQQRLGKKASLLGIAALAISAITLGITPLLHIPQSDISAHQSVLSTQPFSEEALSQAQRTGKPVFVYFTADWCLTCKVNEQAAIERKATAAAFTKAGIITLRGDWTRRDPAITRFLTAQGVAGVPLYLWYPAGDLEAQQLPQILTPSTLPNLATKASQPE